jgi:hypothetical protein
LWNFTALYALEGAHDSNRRAARFTNFEKITLIDLIRRDVHGFSVNTEVTVTYELASIRAGVRKTGTINDVIETALEHREEMIPGDALHGAGLFEETAELTFHQSVHPLDLLLLTKLETVFGELNPTLAMLAWWISTTLESAFFGEAAIALKKELLVFAAANTTN